MWADADFNITDSYLSLPPPLEGRTDRKTTDHLLDNELRLQDMLIWITQKNHQWQQDAEVIILGMPAQFPQRQLGIAD